MERRTSVVEDVMVGGILLAAAPSGETLELPPGEYVWVVDRGDGDDEDFERVIVWTDLKSSCVTRGGVTSRGGVNRTIYDK